MSVDEKGENSPTFDDVDPFTPRNTIRNSPPLEANEYREAANNRGSVSVKCDPMRGTSQSLRESAPQSFDSDDEAQNEAGAVVNASEDSEPSSRIKPRHSSSGTRPRAHPAHRALMRSIEQQAAEGRIAAPSSTVSFGDDENEMMKYSDSDVVKIKQQLQTDFQSTLLTKEHQWEEKFRQLESDNSKLKSEKERMTTNMEEMKNCVLEYERTLQQVLEDRSGKSSTTGAGDVSVLTSSTSNASIQEIMAERDQAVEDLATVEKAFGDLHRRFEKSKQVIEAVKKNEETLKKCLQETMAKLKRHEQKYQTLKQHAEEKLDQANNEIEKARRSNEAEIARLQAALKKSELQLQGLEAQLEQKNKENRELTQICDELIAKCGNQ